MKSIINKFSKIVVSTHDSLDPVRGGGALRTLNVAGIFKRQGHQVILIGPTENNASEWRGIKIISLKPPRKQRSQILSALKFNFRLLIKFISLAKNTDIFFVHNTIAAATLPFLKKIFHFRLVLDITDIHAEYLRVGKRCLFERILTPLLIGVEYAIIKSADFIIVATGAMKNLLIAKGIPGDKIKVVYDGVDKEQIPQEKEAGAENGVIHLGAIDYQHGVEVLVQAIPAVIAKLPQTKFFFVGGGRKLSEIKKLAESLGVKESCVFTDHCVCRQAREFLKKAQIGIIPRQDNLPNSILTTLKIFEYWASRTAVISSFFAGIGEIALEKENILWFNSGDSQDLGEKIILLLKNPELREKISAGGFNAVNKFNAQDLALQIAGAALPFSKNEN
jgi:glycosyltransferase involved in cell wall biosynthesis